jgi:hypothetical protein
MLNHKGPRPGATSPAGTGRSKATEGIAMTKRRSWWVIVLAAIPAAAVVAYVALLGLRFLYR